MRNRMGDSDQDYNILSYREFISYSAFTNLDLFAGEKDLKELIDAYLQEKILQAKKEGYQKAQQDFKEEIKKIINLARSEIDSYINLVTRIADYAYEKTGEIFKEALKIVETRTNFYFGTQRIRILFVVEGDYTKEIELANFLQGIEKEVFEKENFFCELLYINKKGADLNSPSVDSDFPLVRTRKNRGS